MGGTNSGRKATINKGLVRQYKAEGHTNRDTAEHFGISFEYTKQICKGMGAPEGYVNQYTAPEFDNTENVKAWVKRCNPDMEYEGGFKDFDSPILIRCAKCGEVFSRSMVSIRHGRRTYCPICRQRTIEAEGTHHARRRKQILRNMVDRDITLKGLYERDGGICWICGGVCDWSDYTVRGRRRIAGNHYPSIDHVQALINGGSHAWSNVRLAHRICNVKRFWGHGGEKESGA